MLKNLVDQAEEEQKEPLPEKSPPKRTFSPDRLKALSSPKKRLDQDEKSLLQLAEKADQPAVEKAEESPTSKPAKKLVYKTDVDDLKVPKALQTATRMAKTKNANIKALPVKDTTNYQQTKKKTVRKRSENVKVQPINPAREAAELDDVGVKFSRDRSTKTFLRSRKQ